MFLMRSPLLQPWSPFPTAQNPTVNALRIGNCGSGKGSPVTLLYESKWSWIQRSSCCAKCFEEARILKVFLFFQDAASTSTTNTSCGTQMCRLSVCQDLIVDQTIEKVSFCAPDRNYDKAFSYICRDGTTRRWMCHCFMALKDSVRLSQHVSLTSSPNSGWFALICWWLSVHEVI